MIKLNINGMTEINKKIAEARKKYPEQCKKALELSCISVERRAKHEVPVDTGRLKASITYEVKDFSGYVGTNVEYAPYVEFGTSRMNAQPYLLPALYNSKAEIKKIFEDVLNGIEL